MVWIEEVGELCHAVRLADETKAAVLPRMPVEPNGIFVRVPEFAEDGRRPTVKFKRLRDDEVAARSLRTRDRTVSASGNGPSALKLFSQRK